MKGFEFKPPKEFGPRNDTALGKLHGLHNTPVPFAKAITPGAVSYKNNGFDIVINDPLAPISPARIVLEGRTASSGGVSSLYAAGALRGRFTLQALSVIGGDAGSIALGVNASVLNQAYTSSVNFSIWRATSLRAKTLEFSDSVAYTTVQRMWFQVDNAAYYRVGPVESPTITAYEVCVFNSRDGSSGCVVPQVVYSAAGVWDFALVAAYTTHDHYFGARGTIQLAPSVYFISHAVVPFGNVYGLATAGVYSPTGQVPYPLSQISTDCARTFAPLDLDFMYAGCYDSMTYVSGVGTTTGLGGLAIHQSMIVIPLLNSVFISFQLQIDSPAIYETRIFRVDALNFTGATRLSLPGGHNELWSIAPIGAFASPIGPNLQGTLGYVLSAVGENLPAVIFITEDNGATWQGPRPLPCIERFGSTVVEVSDRELWLSVYEPLPAPQVVHYSSRDFGLTWQRQQVIATNALSVSPTTGNLNDFVFPLVLTDGTPRPANGRPMNPAVYDSRIANTPRLPPAPPIP